ncbi:hypothetical protein ID866_1810 [Astraeus odoratus]|nr:hypothetical protein ID866_1810 [Astraeus odoratus]
MLVAIGFVPWFRPVSLALFGVGVVLQLAYSAWQSAGLWRGRHPQEATTPGLYLPTVANNFISAMACGALGFNDAGLVFLGAGVFSWLSLEPVILQRLRSAGELPTAQRTALGIQLAPALVACSAWFSVNGGEADTFAKMLFGYGLLQLLFMLRLLPWYVSQPFNASFWSFSFGVSALATTGLHLGHGSSSGFFHAIAVPLFIFTNLIIGMLLVQVLYSAGIVKPGKTLDLGCGNGRNSLYLAANGHEVTAWDKNPMSVDNIERIKAAEGIENLHTAVKDLNSLSFDGEYDFILSTVVLMFLEAKTIPGLIANMQRCTKPGGYNLIVAAMDTADYPCTVGFPFAFKSGELSSYYEGWELLKYNEEVGELHRTDENGNRIKLRFATMLARKPA